MRDDDVFLSRKTEKRFKDAFNAFYSVMFSSVCGKTGDPDAAEDITQDLFMRLYRKMDEVENTRAWLYGALRIVMLDYYRAKGRADADIETMLDDASLSYVNGFRETRIMIQDAIEAPGTFENDIERSLFDLVAVNGFSYADAARHLDISYRQARYGFDKVSKRITAYFSGKGIVSMEELL